MNLVSSLDRLLVNIAMFITFDRVAVQLLHASLHWCRISNVYQQTGCSSLGWTPDLANTVVWSYFHVAWSIPVVSQESYDHLPYIKIAESFLTWSLNVVRIYRWFRTFFNQGFLQFAAQCLKVCTSSMRWQVSTLNIWTCSASNEEYENSNKSHYQKVISCVDAWQIQFTVNEQGERS